MKKNFEFLFEFSYNENNGEKSNVDLSTSSNATKGCLQDIFRGQDVSKSNPIESSPIEYHEFYKHRLNIMKITMRCVNDKLGCYGLTVISDSSRDKKKKNTGSVWVDITKLAMFNDKTNLDKLLKFANLNTYEGRQLIKFSRSRIEESPIGMIHDTNYHDTILNLLKDVYSKYLVLNTFLMYNPQYKRTNFIKFKAQHEFKPFSIMYLNDLTYALIIDFYNQNQKFEVIDCIKRTDVIDVQTNQRMFSWNQISDGITDDNEEICCIPDTNIQSDGTFRFEGEHEFAVLLMKE
jgi:hypothetical protein